MVTVKDQLILTEDIFELREVEYRVGSRFPATVSGFVVWNTVRNCSEGAGIVPSLREAETVLDTAVGAERALRATEAARIAGRRPTSVTGWC